MNYFLKCIVEYIKHETVHNLKVKIKVVHYSKMVWIFAMCYTLYLFYEYKDCKNKNVKDTWAHERNLA